jgi:TolB-like protein/class 3 adenylate cyclase
MKPTDSSTTAKPNDNRKKLAAVMFADMVEYSKRLEEDEARNSVQAAKAIELFKALIGDYGGHVANVAGDGILALFDSADRALRFAIQIQAEFRDQSVWGDGDPIQFRIGLNLGEVSVRDGNVHGHCVNVAARIQALAEPHGVLVTAGLRSAVRQVAGVHMRSLGPQKLKNISEPTEVFSVEKLASLGTRATPSALQAPKPALEPLRAPTVAVLALANFSGDPRNDHLCEGIAEDIIANLTRFRSLMVIARHSAFLFNLTAMSAQEVQRRLGARYILSGSLRRANMRLRIAVELVNAASDSVLWSDRFDIEVEDLFDLQDAIAAAVATRLSVQIELAEFRQESTFPRDMRAYGLVVRGHHLTRQFSKEANAHARRLFEEAVELDPYYSRAFSAMSRTHNLDWRYGWSATPEESLDSALALARHATDLDRLDARSFAELGNAKLHKKQLEESLDVYQYALTLNPNDSDVIAEYADALVYAGQPQRSLELLEKAIRLNPYHPDSYLLFLADAYLYLGQYSDVIAAIRRMQDPSEGRRLLAIAYSHQGMIAEARAAAAEVLRLQPGFTISEWCRVPPFREGPALERYLDGLRKAGLPD